MTSDWENPFRIVETPDGPMQAGLLPGAGVTQLSSDQIRTLVLVGEPGTAGGEAIMKLPGHWTPKIGAVIQLAEPNRDAIVYDLHYRLEPEALSVFVYVHDPIERVYDPVELAGSSG